MSVFQQKRPMAAQLAFGSTTRPSSSMHDPVALLPPPQVWRPRPVSEEIGSLGWNGTPVDIRPAAVLISSHFPAARDGAFTTSWNGGCKRPVSSPPGKREWCTAGPRGSHAKSSERPVTANAAAEAKLLASSPRAQEADSTPPQPPPTALTLALTRTRTRTRALTLTLTLTLSLTLVPSAGGGGQATPCIGGGGGVARVPAWPGAVAVAAPCHRRLAGEGVGHRRTALVRRPAPGIHPAARPRPPARATDAARRRRQVARRGRSRRFRAGLRTAVAGDDAARGAQAGRGGGAHARRAGGAYQAGRGVAHPACPNGDPNPNPNPNPTRTRTLPEPEPKPEPEPEPEPKPEPEPEPKPNPSPKQAAPSSVPYATSETEANRAAA